MRDMKLVGRVEEKVLDAYFRELEKRVCQEVKQMRGRGPSSSSLRYIGYCNEDYQEVQKEPLIWEEGD